MAGTAAQRGQSAGTTQNSGQCTQHNPGSMPTHPGVSALHSGYLLPQSHPAGLCDYGKNMIIYGPDFGSDKSCSQ